MMVGITMLKKEYFDILTAIVAIGKTADLEDLRAKYKAFVDEYTVPFSPSIAVESCVYGFSQPDMNFLQSLQFLPTLSPEALKTYAEFYRANDNRGMMQALQRYGTESGYTISGLLEDPETMLSTFDGVLAKATEVMEMDKTTEEYITAKEQLQSMIDQALRPAEIVVTAKN